MRERLLIFLVGSAICLSTFAVISVPKMEAETLKASESLKWYKGNLHTHSHWSDGDDYLEMIALWYQNHDYDFLCFTDHNVLADKEKWVAVDKTKGGRVAYDKLKAQFPDWIEERTTEDVLEVRLRRFTEVSEKFDQPGEFLLIQGEEISDHFHKHPIHMNASNVQEVLSPRGGVSVFETIQNNVDAVVAQRLKTGEPILIHLNHPNFGYAVTAEDLMKVQGEKFFEVYNGHPGVHNSGDETHASTERIWDIVLSQRLGVLDLPVMYGLATDDGHNYHTIPSRKSEPGRGWVMVLAKDLSPEALIEALEAGQFYASSGVTLKEIVTTSSSLAVTVDAIPGEEYTIEFIGTKRGADLKGTPVLDDKGNPLPVTQLYSSDIGTVFKTVQGTQGEYEFAGDEFYVRARVTSSAKHPNPSENGDLQRAWVQPVTF